MTAKIFFIQVAEAIGLGLVAAGCIYGLRIAAKMEPPKEGKPTVKYVDPDLK